MTWEKFTCLTVGSGVARKTNAAVWGLITGGHACGTVLTRLTVTSVV